MSSIGGLGLSGTGISFSGLASGLDTSAIISALLAVEQRPISLLENTKSTLQNEKSLFSDLEQRLDNLRSKADTLRNASNFLEYQANVDDETYFSATASSGAASGTYSIGVQSLAQAQVSNSAIYTNQATLLGGTGAKLTFTVGTQSPVEVDISNQTNSLQDIADAINGQGIGVTAQVLQTGTSGDYRLVLTGEEGLDNAFTVAGSGTQDIIDLGTELSTNTAQSASNASITINGIAVTRSSNQISDAITGVTLDLKAVSPATNTLTVSTDTAATGAKVKDVVDAYNNVLDFMAAQSAIDPNTNEARSSLFGDSTLRGIQTTLRGIVGSSVNTGNAAYALLSQAGVTSDQEGRLTFDQSAFDAAVIADEDAVKNLFADSTNGIAERVYQLTDDYLDTIDGLLVTRQQGYDRRIKDIDGQIEVAERRLEQTRVSLTNRFANLEVLLSQLQSQGSALGGLPSPGGS